MTLTSAAGVIALLEETEPELKFYALKKLDNIVGEFWAEISDVITKIEELCENDGFRHRDLSCLVASKVYYHLGAFEDSVLYALGAGDLFDVNGHTEYIETTIAKCIDHYTQLRVRAATHPDEEVKIDQRLIEIVNKMFQRCFADKKFKQAIGIALETRRLDIFEQAVLKSEDVQGMLGYSLSICMTLIESRSFRNEVLRVLVKLYLNLTTPDHISVSQCLIFLDDPDSVADIMEKLVKSSEEQTLMAYQIGFDLYENASQQFLTSIRSVLKSLAPAALAEPVRQGTTPKEGTDTQKDDAKPMETDETNKTESKEEPAEKPVKQEKHLNENEKTLQDRIIKLTEILSGDTMIKLHLEFLIRNNHADLLILKNTKDIVRNSICHSATVISNAFMHCGTTSDTFLRNNLEWLARATNWAKFTATASLGVIHKGHEKESLKLMGSYLPKDGGAGSAYQEGGGLYALGLIHCNHGESIKEYLLQQLKNATTDMVRHGGCLGLGLAAMGTQQNDIYEQLKFNLYQDDAVTGEAAGIGMGLVMLASKSSQAIEDMVMYAQETQHEKILRGLAIGIALVMYGRMEEADALIESLLQDKDAILRRSAMYTIAMAYAGTGNNKAIRKLLHVAVSDVNDDVRRAAVQSLGFLLFRTPEQVPSVVSLLSESYNPHVRCGAAMALGIACAGTGLKEAINLVEPLMNDPVNYVRQYALIASALITIQQTEVTCPKVKQMREAYTKVIADKHEDSIAKFGAILAQGIIDAGGRNATVSLQSRAGQNHMPTIVGLFVFSQFWYWFPLSHFLSLSFTPTAIIGLNSNLKMPKIEFCSNAKPSVYAYPELLQPPKKEEKEKVSTAILSITAKAKARQKKANQEEAMEVDDKADKKDEAMETTKSEKEKESDKTKEKDEDESEKPKEEEKKKEVEPDFQMIDNPARVMPAQLKKLSLSPTCRYQPLKSVNAGGIIIMKDTQSEQPEDLIEPLPASTTPAAADEEDEPEPPEPFEYTED
ncbi:26S proteasome non-ATPase regulatory subunit 1-like [Hydractinia symbiolongicarpus]|uniref:26S proteasome non-ATPase regulatory subunit 1-like n=1 Tax=Hydractinia symbiolongicarpus TaxID=13093 RepID=UPI00254F5FE7|nr:26S proteasome non-ATPase regulatory subunit 1-like [Hydractinia symbiolongicarpus]